MQVEHVEVSVVRVPPDAPYQASGRTVDAYWHVLARVRTRDGAAGFGYIVALNAALVQAVASACRELGEQLVGANVMEPEAAWERLYRRGSWSGPGGLLHFAIAPLDIALWDAAGKTLGQPLYRMLGGFRDRLPVYGSDGLWYNLSLDALAANARRYADRGFTAVKLRIGHETDPAKEVARVQAVRDACGPAMRVLVDATETWDLATALNTGYALQDAGIHWLEDPIHHDNVSGYANLCRQLRVRIATGEHIYTAAGFLRLFEQRGTTIALVDLGLPSLDGFGVVEALRRSCPDLKTRLVALTGYGQASDYERTQRAGFHDHLVKPASSATILACLTKQLEDST